MPPICADTARRDDPFRTADDEPGADWGLESALPFLTGLFDGPQATAENLAPVLAWSRVSTG